MFPISDENPHFLTPWTTIGLIAINILAWVFVQGLGSEPKLGASVCTLGLVPGELLQTLAAGTRFEIGPGMQCVLTDTPNWASAVSHMFLHGGWLHIIGNLWFLWIFGTNVEDSMGHLRFLVFYLLCGVAAAALQIYSDPRSGIPMVGASGAIGGVMGAYVLLYPKVQVKMLVFLGIFVTTFTVPAFWMLGYWFVAQFIGGIGSIGAQGGGVAFWAHVGGFIAGAAMIFLFRDPELVRRHPYYGWS
ncbi:MAG: rhomboid family intramembrane serine protease [Chromatiales bacterium]|nr:rhomboid family intramembrane serine protease [Chromatiales bacterium]